MPPARFYSHTYHQVSAEVISLDINIIRNRYFISLMRQGCKKKKKKNLQC